MPRDGERSTIHCAMIKKLRNSQPGVVYITFVGGREMKLVLESYVDGIALVKDLERMSSKECKRNCMQNGVARSRSCC